MGRNRLQSPEKIKDILMKALDDLVSVNSLFTAAVFIGLSFASPNQRSLEISRPECDPSVKMGKRLVLYEVVSFSSFLLSSLVAKSLRVYLRIFYSDTKAVNGNNPGKPDLNDKKKYNLFHAGRGLMFALSMLASIVGVVFLTISMALVVEIKIGKLSCGIHETQAAVIALTTIVPFALIIYIPSLSAALLYCVIEP
ncbi:hypothetical protein JCGZ_15085 [Jatropha curcas]|uniref:PGG domain-containing protein n=1 Tax=Jatropha curcas TaxID=180498 RepID=A0A067LKM1_JATCU|nr:uncharacterized protein LOC105644816 [Jatropha curcas]KDP45220.1 hypothetical protein JCGZ_15085 [Jatropha curcas]